VLISYAHDDAGHCERVAAATLDVLAEVEQQCWPDWMSEQIRLARFVVVVVVASPVCRRRASAGQRLPR
jgi:hypothetical protein